MAQTYPVINPRTRAPLYEVEDPDGARIGEVMRTAREAHERLRAPGMRARTEAVGRLKRLLLDRAEAIAERIVGETGKADADALILEVIHVIDTLAYYEKNAARILADRTVKTPLIMMGKKSRVYFEPLGPVLVIAPWNFPFDLVMIPAISAYLAGNAVIVKPSECAPLRGLFEGLFRESGFPEGAIQVVHGGGPAAEALIDAGPAKVFFTGSAATARKVLARAAARLIPVDLELGGKDAMIVFEDAGLERAAEAALWGAMANAGQTCIAIERLYVHRTVCEKFSEVLKRKAENLRVPRTVGDSREIDMGCMTTRAQIEKVEELVRDAVAQGARLVTGGARLDSANVFSPTILTGVNPQMRIQREEAMGPVLTVTPFSAEDEAVALANDSDYGLGASVWTADPERADRIARRLAVGNVTINNVLLTAVNPALPFGGARQSGFGRTKGPWGLHAFCTIKSVVIDRPRALPEPHWYPYSTAKNDLILKMTRLFFGRDPLALLKMFLPGMRLFSLLRKKRD